MSIKENQKETKVTFNDGTSLSVIFKDGMLYPASSFVVWLHEEVANEGIRDEAGLDMICYKVRTRQYPAIIDKASFLLYEIATKHPFFNGNKRTALITALVFLAVNDYGIDITKHFNDEETKKFMLEVAGYKKSRKEVKAFLEKKLKN